MAWTGGGFEPLVLVGKWEATVNGKLANRQTTDLAPNGSTFDLEKFRQPLIAGSRKKRLAPGLRDQCEAVDPRGPGLRTGHLELQH